MNNLTFNGKITNILPVMSGTTTNGDWKSINFVVKEDKAEYPQSASFKLFGEEKVDNFLKYNSVGDDVEVSFNLTAREYEGKFYTNVDAWKVYKKSAATSGQSTPNTPPIEEEKDDLPF